MTRKRPIPPSHNFASMNKEAEKPATRPTTEKRMPIQTRGRETGSGSLGSNGGPEPNGGCAMMSVSCAVFCVASESRI